MWEGGSGMGIRESSERGGSGMGNRELCGRVGVGWVLESQVEGWEWDGL